MRADYLSHVSAMRHHSFRLRAELFQALNARWGPNYIDRLRRLTIASRCSTHGPLLLPLLFSGGSVDDFTG